MKGRKHGLPGMLLLFFSMSLLHCVCPQERCGGTIHSSSPSSPSFLWCSSCSLWRKASLWLNYMFIYAFARMCVHTGTCRDLKTTRRSQFSPSAPTGPEVGTQVVRFGDSAITHWAISPALCTVLRHRYRELINLLWSVLRVHSVSDRRVWGITSAVICLSCFELVAIYM